MYIQNICRSINQKDTIEKKNKKDTIEKKNKTRQKTLLRYPMANKSVKGTRSQRNTD